MFCRNCGAQLDDDALYCEKCGTKISSQNSANTDMTLKSVVNEVLKESTDTEILRESANVQTTPNPAVSDNAPKGGAKKKSLKGILIGFVAVALVTVVVVASLLFGGIGGSAVDKLNSYANFNNGAKVAFDDKRLYIIGLYNEDDEDDSLYSTDYDGNNKTLLSYGEKIYKIRLIDGKIYYTTSDDERYTIGVMDTDGTNNITIVTNEESFDCYDAYDGKLYYLLDSKLHTCTINGEEDTIILESIKDFIISKGYIYYANEEDAIKSYHIANGEIKPICQSSNVSRLSTDDKILYFVCDTGLSSVTIGDGNTNVVIADSSVEDYVFYGESIYYKQKWSSEYLKEVTKYLSNKNGWDYLVSYIFLGACGDLMKEDMVDGHWSNSDINTDQSIVTNLYSYPQGLYSIVFAWDYTPKPIQFNK